MGLNEPDPAQNEVKPDVFFIPLAAFDRKGHRLGYGRGYFDASLAQARAERKVLAVGLAYNCQEIPAVPISDHDQRLDFVITESETLDFG
jgi:5-formyltetrahydrofolate cyclo-ligase